MAMEAFNELEQQLVQHQLDHQATNPLPGFHSSNHECSVCLGETTTTTSCCQQALCAACFDGIIRTKVGTAEDGRRCYAKCPVCRREAIDVRIPRSFRNQDTHLYETETVSYPVRITLTECRRCLEYAQGVTCGFCNERVSLDRMTAHTAAHKEVMEEEVQRYREAVLQAEFNLQYEMAHNQYPSSQFWIPADMTTGQWNANDFQFLPEAEVVPEVMPSPTTASPSTAVGEGVYGRSTPVHAARETSTPVRSSSPVSLADFFGGNVLAPLGNVVGFPVAMAGVDPFLLPFDPEDADLIWGQGNDDGGVANWAQVADFLNPPPDLNATIIIEDDEEEEESMDEIDETIFID